VTDTSIAEDDRAKFGIFIAHMLDGTYGRSCCGSGNHCTDHSYAVSTREYQFDHSSPLPATASGDPVLLRKNDQRTLTGHYSSISE
jgi:hypothetical protein